MRECGESEDKDLEEKIQRISWGDEKMAGEFYSLSQTKLPHSSKNLWMGQSQRKRKSRGSVSGSAGGSRSVSAENRSAGGSGSGSGSVSAENGSVEGSGSGSGSVSVENGSAFGSGSGSGSTGGSGSGSAENGSVEGSGSGRGSEDQSGSEVQKKGDENQEGTGETKQKKRRIQNEEKEMTQKPVQSGRKRLRNFTEMSDDGSQRRSERIHQASQSASESTKKNKKVATQQRGKKKDKKEGETKKREMTEEKLKRVKAIFTAPQPKRKETQMIGEEFKEEGVREVVKVPSYKPYLIGDISIPTRDEYEAAVKALADGNFDKHSFSKKDLIELLTWQEWISDSVSCFSLIFFC